MDYKKLASKIFYEASKLTWKNRKGKLGEVEELFSDFSGLRGYEVGGLPLGTKSNMNFDGVGTKIEIAERRGRHETVFYDLFAMVCDDAVLKGGEPVVVGSVFDASCLGNESEDFSSFINMISNGMIEAAKDAGVAVVNGETAELGYRVKGYGKFNYNLCAGAVWYGHESRLLSGKEIRVGNSLVGLYEEGFRSNGFTLVREIMEKVHGENWHDVKWVDGKNSLGDMALTPSRIYSKAIVDMTGGYDTDRKPKALLHDIAHITGGGIPEKLGRVLENSGYGAEIDNPFMPSEFVRYVQDLGNVSDREAYKTWSMGQGMVVITPEPSEVMNVAKMHGIESRVIGHVKYEPTIKIFNCGSFAPTDSQQGILYENKRWLNYKID